MFRIFLPRLVSDLSALLRISSESCTMDSVQAAAASIIRMSPYQQCPYCEAVIEITGDDRSAMERHIRTTHAEQDTRDSLRKQPIQ
jgi:hypothetical protein